MVKILDLSEHMGLRIAGLLQGISRLHPGYIGLRAGPVTSLLHSLLEIVDCRRRRRANDSSAFFGHTITRHPDQAWMQQMARNATGESWGFLDQRRYVLHDRDSKFCSLFRATLKAGGIQAISLPARSPNLNAYAERWVRSAKEECLTKLVLFGEASLRRALADFIDHYHGERNHQGKGNTLLFQCEKTGQHGPAAEYAVGSGSVGY